MIDDGRDILVALRNRGLRIWLDPAGKIRVGPRELVDEVDRAVVREHRDAVTIALADEAASRWVAGGRPADPAVSSGGRERL